MSKGTEEFKKTILNYVCDFADKDKLFAAKFADSKKSIDDCVTYILNYVQKSGINCFTDNEIFGQAIHYYEEDNVVVGSKIDIQVVVNHTVELSEDEKTEIKGKAMEEYHDKIASNLGGGFKRPGQQVKKPTETLPSLFDEE